MARNQSLSRFQYLPMDLEKNEIRLLSIAPGSPFDDVRCKLFHTSMDDTRRVLYRALSYTWNDDSTTALRKPASFAGSLFATLKSYFRQLPLLPPHQIYVDGQIVEVTESLGQAIRRLRSESDHTTIWIDAICINQDDIPERNHQVSKMRRIYQDAEQVVVWLGSERDESKLAFAFVRDMNKFSKSPEWIRRMVVNPNTLSHFHALWSLFTREYWHRIWPVQEITCAKDIVVFCGSDSISWSELSAVSLFMTTYHGALTHPLHRHWHYTKALVRGGPASSRTFARGDVSKPPSLLELLLAHLDKHATDPRDKVYALVGISSTRGDYQFVVDYSLSVGEVYTNAAKYEISTTRKLDIICAHSSDLSALVLPSWVPDWTAYNSKRPIHGLHMRDPAKTHAAGSSYAEIRWDKNGAYLYARGFCFDTAKAVGQPCEDDGPTYGRLNHVLKIFLDWRKLYIASKSDSVVDGVLEYEAFSRTLFCDTYACPVKEDEPPAPHNAFLGAFGRMSREVFPDLILDEQLSMFADNTKLGRGSRGVDLTFVRNMSEMMRGRCFFISSSNLIGLVPKRTTKEDKICVLLGCSYPVILREQSDHFILIGAAYVDGFMDGKAMEGLTAGNYKLQEFEIH